MILLDSGVFKMVDKGRYEDAMLTERRKVIIREEVCAYMNDEELEMFYQYLDRAMVVEEMGYDSSKMPITPFY